MSELQPVIIQSDGDYVRCSLGELYLKEEVDHYISELIADQQLELDEWYCKVEHHKYKRCLAMAKWCETQFSYYLATCDRYGSEYVNKKAHHFYKWKHNWLALAEKFKEAK